MGADETIITNKNIKIIKCSLGFCSLLVPNLFREAQTTALLGRPTKVKVLTILSIRFEVDVVVNKENSH